MRPRPLARDTSAGPLRKEGGHLEDTLETACPVLTWEVGARAPTAGGPLPRSCKPTALPASRAIVFIAARREDDVGHAVTQACGACRVRGSGDRAVVLAG
jgi:hypothetical protein